MKIVKIIVGSLGVLFALAHVVGLIGALTQKASNFGSAYSTGGLFGRIAGIAIGVAIASVCFRKKKEPPQRNARSRPSSGDSSASETPFSLGPRG